jgi:hypothetical protein
MNKYASSFSPDEPFRKQFANQPSMVTLAAWNPASPRLPPRETFVLAFEEGKGWWQAQHCPVDDTPNDGIADWHFLSHDAYIGWGRVTHWLPMPPASGEAS